MSQLRTSGRDRGPLQHPLETSSFRAQQTISLTEKILLEYPELLAFRERNSWVIDQPRLQQFLLNVSIDPAIESPQHHPIQTTPLFSDKRHYTPAHATTVSAATVHEIGFLQEGDDLTNCIGLTLLKKIGESDFADYTETAANNRAKEDCAETVARESDFLSRWTILRVGICNPQGISLNREVRGQELYSKAKQLIEEPVLAQLDKVSQRSIVQELEVAGLHQPQFVDVRELTPRQRLLIFHQIDLSNVPLDFITQAPHGEKRILMFEDTTQGFTVVHDGEKVFVHSDNERIANLIVARNLEAPRYPSEAFRESYELFAAELSGRRGIAIHLIDNSDSIATWDRNDNDRIALADALTAHGESTFIKSADSAGGRLIVNVKQSQNGEASIRSDSPEVGEALVKLIRRREDIIAARQVIADENVVMAPKILVDQPLARMQRLCTVRGFLGELIKDMQAPIVEQAIPVMRLETPEGSEKIEFRLILQGDEQLAIVGHYAKASPNEIAANISLGGHSRRTYQTIEGLYRQQLSDEHSEDEIHAMSQEARERLLAVAQTLGERYAAVVKSRTPSEGAKMRDFAVDICPVWDDATRSIQYWLLEVQYSYAYQGLQDVEPEMAAQVTAFKEKTATRLQEEARQMKLNKALQRYVAGFLGILE